MESFEFKDRYGRIMKPGDICLRMTSGSTTWNKPSIEVVEVIEFRNYKVRISDRRYVFPHKLIKLSIDNLDLNAYLNRKLSI